MQIKKKLPLLTTLLASTVAASACLVVGWLAYEVADDAVVEQRSQQLKTMRDVKAERLKQLYSQFDGHARVLAHEKWVKQAINDFKLAANVVIPTTAAADTKSLTNFYQSQFQKKYDTKTVDANLDATAFVKALTPRQRALQAAYISDNKHPLGEKHNSMSSGKFALYDRMHNKYHPEFKYFLETYGYYDIFLVDPKTGVIIYSVFKEIDYMTSLFNGSFANSGIAEAFKTAFKAGKDQPVRFTQFAPYTPSYEAQASFFGAPIYDGSDLLGVVIFQIPVELVDGIMSDNQSWKKLGLGDTGESYLVNASTGMLNSTSRSVLTDFDKFKQLASAQGASPQALTLMERQGTNMGITTVASSAFEQGKSTSAVVSAPNYLGVESLSAVMPFSVPGIDWVVVSEMATTEAFAVVTKMRDELILVALFATLALTIVFSGMGIMLSRRLVNPISTLSDFIVNSAQRLDLSSNYQDITKDEIGDIAQSMNSLVSNINTTLSNSVKSLGSLNEASETLKDKFREIDSSTNEQKAQTDNVAAAITELTASAEQIASSAQEANTFGEQISEASDKGQRDVTATVSGVKQISNDFEKSRSAIRELSDNIENIHSILETIRGIAEQTNLLALNAAIEAARAGEHGRGFAVVSDEVRNLARRTQDSTSQIQDITDKVTSSCSEVSRIIDDQSSSIQENTEKAVNMQASFEAINSKIKDIIAVVNSISVSASEQSSVTNEINSNIIKIVDSSSGNLDRIQTLNHVMQDVKAYIDCINESTNQFTL